MRRNTLRTCSLALSSLSSLLLALWGGTAAAAVHVDNPFESATAYINPDYAALVDTSIAKTTDSTLIAKMRTVKKYPTAVWLDRIAAVHGGSANGGRKSLRDHLDLVLAQKKPDQPITATFVIYDMPGRDCAALASNGELPLTAEGLQRYKTEYIDAIATVFSDPVYQDIRIVAVIEPDGLPNLVTNLSDPECAQANSSGIYVAAARYALNKLHAIQNVYTYLDIAHSGWLGWDNNRQGIISLYTDVVGGTTAGLASADGFVTNTANYTPLVEPNLVDPNVTVGGQQLKSAKYYEWNPHFDESDFAAALYTGFTSAGWPASIGFLIDTSRNGWGGSSRPTGATGSTVDTYADSGRVDRRAHRGLWCNHSGTGIGQAPQSSPAGYTASHLDAFVWVKPPGESDGASEEIPNNEGKGADPMCNPDYTTKYNTKSGALPNAPLSGHWFHNQFAMLVQNAYPVIPPTQGDNEPPFSPTGLTATPGNQQVTLRWTASLSATSYTVKRGTASNGPFATVTSVTGTTYAHTGLTNGTTYYFVVSASNSHGESANTSTVSATPGNEVLPAPTSLLATATSSSQINLSWTGAAGATGYNIYRSTSPNVATTATNKVGNRSTASFTDTGLLPNTAYYYKVTAFNASLESAASSEVSATTQNISTGTLSVLYRDGDNNAPSNNQIRPHLRVKNGGTASVNLADIKVRYYFSLESPATLQVTCDWAVMGCGNTGFQFVQLASPRPGASHYLEISFLSGTLAAGQDAGDIQLRVNTSNWANFNEADDYSFKVGQTAYGENTQIPVYRNGTLAGGIEP
ncbi:glycoside hydrolase family 6 protein [Stigmatella sp. ncwal1]|uniref:Glucanase n=1 Tax=Stigmatella ashevillensis TaxID=2995309 RepID=A0ABT5DLH6_9BACT|nr:glycoside hydrolase family 6 protein [Stigmatella ashevillena]MDC0714521.1 glycoside hydrolase family 6 protein [Stigmatella ashevillena]